VKDFSLSDLDMIVNLASRASPKDFPLYPLEIIRALTIGSMNLLELCRRTDARYLLASSSEVYGEVEKIPTPETYRGNTSCIGPRSCYDEGKRIAEAIAIAYMRKYDIDVRIARIFNTYGPRMRKDDGRAVPNFIESAFKNEPLTIYGTGEQTRSFTYIDDLIEGLLLFLESERISGIPINIGNNEETKIINLAKLIIRITDSTSSIKLLPPLEDDPSRRVPDIRRVKELLGWVPQTNLERGLRQTVAMWDLRDEDNA